MRQALQQAARLLLCVPELRSLDQVCLCHACVADLALGKKIKCKKCFAGQQMSAVKLARAPLLEHDSILGDVHTQWEVGHDPPLVSLQARGVPAPKGLVSGVLRRCTVCAASSRNVLQLSTAVKCMRSARASSICSAQQDTSDPEHGSQSSQEHTIQPAEREKATHVAACREKALAPTGSRLGHAGSLKTLTQRP